MPQKDERKIRRVKDKDELSRRQFIKGAGVVLGGAAVASIALATGCKSAGTTTFLTTNEVSTTQNPITPTNTTIPPNIIKTTTTPTNSTTSTATTGMTTTQTSITPTNTSIPPNTTKTTEVTTITSTTPPANTTVNYVPPSKAPMLLETPGCTTLVAADRNYSVDHIWVKLISDNSAVIGVSDKMQALMAAVTNLLLPVIGSSIDAGTSFGFSEGYKMSVDLIAPVSGIVMLENQGLITEPLRINRDPYGAGWIMVVKLTKSEELKGLLNAEEYAILQAKTPI
jgi:glycine cleavage system H protein